MQPVEILSGEALEAIHQTSLKILAEVGVRFSHPRALELFQKHGYQTEGELVFFTENQVMSSLANIPFNFTLRARNGDRDVTVGAGDTVFAPGYGAPFLIDPEEGKQIPTLTDYRRLLQLNQMLPNQDLTGYLLVEPQDVPPEQAHLYMLSEAHRWTDKPMLGSAENGQAAADTLAMAKIVFGDPLEDFVTLGVISALSPLAYSPDMIEAVLAFAGNNQPMIFANLVMAGSTGPITLPGTIAQQNAELLAGIVFAQLIQPGVPVLYGTTSTSIDMRTGGLTIGSPELSLITIAHGQLARYYGLPSRGHGRRTDASTVGAQAGHESMLGMLTAIGAGMDFVLHAAGIMSSYLAFSLAKFVMDDEFCGMVRRLQGGMDVSPESLAFPVIRDVGPGGHFLNQHHTLARCRGEFVIPDIADRSGLQVWWSGPRLDAAARAAERGEELLARYQPPALDPLTERQLASYVKERTA